MDHRINGYGHDHLGIQSNNSMLQLFSSKTELTVDEVVGRICILAKEQKNFHFLMKILTEGTQEDADKVFYGIIDHIGELMVDPVANYLVQNILGNNDRRMRIIYEITKAPAELIKICCNAHGYEHNLTFAISSLIFTAFISYLLEIKFQDSCNAKGHRDYSYPRAGFDACDRGGFDGCDCIEPRNNSFDDRS